MKEAFKLSYDKYTTAKVNYLVFSVLIYKCEVKIVGHYENKKLKKMWKDKQGFSMQTYDYLVEDNTILIRIDDYSDESLVHELHHAVGMIMKWIGHKNDGIDEPSAYLIGYLFKEISKHKKKLSKRK